MLELASPLLINFLGGLALNQNRREVAREGQGRRTRIDFNLTQRYQMRDAK